MNATLANNAAKDPLLPGKNSSTTAACRSNHPELFQRSPSDYLQRVATVPVPKGPAFFPLLPPLPFVRGPNERSPPKTTRVLCLFSHFATEEVG
ncbi:uncharacterized protein VTP21DRAFT_927 [Calcarisporiella thermophila]|uniref:uncharacterized protein n=1 Tax=Calcarisporiella thermophila TaxID=911321 RepID=UPI00374237CA